MTAARSAMRPGARFAFLTMLAILAPLPGCGGGEQPGGVPSPNDPPAGGAQPPGDVPQTGGILVSGGTDAAGFDYAAATAAEQTACAATDADTASFRRLWVSNMDSLRTALDALDRRVAAASQAELPALLLELGRAKTWYSPHQGSPEEAYATARPDEFLANEIGGNWLYVGTDLKALIDRFPASPLVDDAAYALTLLPRGGECEGYVPCYVGWEWQPISEFLRAYPTSPFADSAVDRALAAFRAADPDVDPRLMTEFLDPEDLRSHVEALDEVGRLLPPAPRARLLERAGMLWTRFAEYDRARSAYEAALAPGAAPAGRRTGSDSAVSRAEARAGDDAASRFASLAQCIAARRAALPGRWFVLEPALVIHPARVELRWTPPAGASGFTVHRSATRSEPGTVVARLDADARVWTDTTTTPSTLYWYRLEAETTDARVTSNPAPATTPALRIRVRGAATSTADRWLHVFGVLANGFPQVLRIAPDGSAVARDNARFIGYETGERYEHALDGYVDAVWLPDRGGTGVLRFHRDGDALPSALFDAVRTGGDVLRGDVDGQRFLVSVDQPSGGAWIERGGGGANASTVMDCDAASGRCWHGREGEVWLRDGSGTLATARLPGSGDRLVSGSAIYFDPTDGSAWLLDAQRGRLLHYSATGSLLGSTDLAGASAVTADLRHRAIWFARRGQGAGLDLVRFDVGGATASEHVLVRDIRGLPRLAPDLDGGVWVITRDDAMRVGPDGAIVARVPLDAATR